MHLIGHNRDFYVASATTIGGFSFMFFVSPAVPGLPVWQSLLIVTCIPMVLFGFSAVIYTDKYVCRPLAPRGVRYVKWSDLTEVCVATGFAFRPYQVYAFCVDNKWLWVSCAWLSESSVREVLRKHAPHLKLRGD
jgi:hypothetical protein